MSNGLRTRVPEAPPNSLRHRTRKSAGKTAPKAPDLQQKVREGHSSYGNRAMQKQLGQRWTVTIGDKESKNLTIGQAADLLMKACREVRRGVEGGHEGHRSLDELRSEQWIVGSISDFVGGVEMPPVGMWRWPLHHLELAEAYLDGVEELRDATGILDRTIEELSMAEDKYVECRRKYEEYRKGSTEGTESAITALRVTAAVGSVAGAIAVGTLTGGAATAAGFSTLGEAGAVALAGGAYTALEDFAVQTSEWANGLRSEIDWYKIWRKGSGNVVAGLAGKLVSGALAKQLSKLCGSHLRNISDRELDEINQILKATGTKMTRESWMTVSQQYIIAFFSDMAATAAVEVPIQLTLDEIMKKDKLPSEEEFLKKLNTQFWMSQASTKAFASYVALKSR